MGPLVVSSLKELREVVAGAVSRGKTVGFVPTMGALHAGHARLVEESRATCGFTAVSIFVNPTQFGPNEDYQRYPRTFASDHALCASAGCDAIFTPTVEEMYPNGPKATFVEVPGLSDVLEGKSRPGHFRGVATVVLKLLEAVRPRIAFFGEKDFQQLLVVRRMVSDLNVDVEVRGVATVREPDGLAMSSRNRYLGEEERRAATVLHRALEAAAGATRSGERDAGRVRQILRETIESERMATLDYAEVADASTLEPLSELGGGRGAVALLAARVGPARLIDNRLLPEPAAG